MYMAGSVTRKRHPCTTMHLTWRTDCILIILVLKACCYLLLLAST